MSKPTYSQAVPKWCSTETVSRVFLDCLCRPFSPRQLKVCAVGEGLPVAAPGDGLALFCGDGFDNVRDAPAGVPVPAEFAVDEGDEIYGVTGEVTAVPGAGSAGKQECVLLRGGAEPVVNLKVQRGAAQGFLDDAHEGRVNTLQLSQPVGTELKAVAIQWR